MTADRVSLCVWCVAYWNLMNFILNSIHSMGHSRMVLLQCVANKDKINIQIILISLPHAHTSSYCMQVLFTASTSTSRHGRLCEIRCREQDLWRAWTSRGLLCCTTADSLRHNEWGLTHYMCVVSLMAHLYMGILYPLCIYIVGGCPIKFGLICWLFCQVLFSQCYICNQGLILIHQS